MVSVFILASGAKVFAQSLSQDDAKSIYGDTVWYDTNDSSTGTGSCSNTPLSGNDREQQAWNYFKSQGLSDPQTAGVMGNIYVESHFDPEVMQIGGDSQNPYDAGALGWGIVQWSGNKGPRSTGDKVTSIYKDTGASGPVYELSTELFMVWNEMNGTSPTGVTDMVSGLKKINDAAQAASYFNTNFEGGADAGNIREQDAIEILGKYGGTGPSGVNTGNCGSPVATSSCKLAYKAEYSRQQLAHIFGNPGTANSHPDLHLTSVDFMGYKVEVSPVIAPCLNSVEQQIKSANIKYKITSVGCYRFDSNNGGSNIGLSSYHTYGAACDVNPFTNNFYDTGPVPYNPNCPPASGVVDSGHCYDMSPQLVKIFADNGFYWGGNFNSVKDYMHFEWHGLVP
jgi:hypothetical protein